MAATDADRKAREDAVAILPLDLRRKAQIGKGGPTDHHGEVTIAAVDVDIDKTIFKSVTSCLARSVVKSRVGILPLWPDQVVHRYTEMYAKIPKPPSHDKAIIDFLVQEANLSCEHADGSFMDHLQFCYEYSNAYYKAMSPRILLLHSIMGVGTNYFPITKEQIPTFKALLTEEEWKHVEAFPSVLRLLQHGPLMDDLIGMEKAKFDKIDGISFHRVIDNEPLTFNKEEFWVQLQFHLMHTLDFLPAEDWGHETGDNFLWCLSSLHRVLTKADKLLCHVDMNLKPAFPNSQVQGKQGSTLGGMIRNCAPACIQLKLARKQITKFSADIGHDLSYELKFSS